MLPGYRYERDISRLDPAPNRTQTDTQELRCFAETYILERFHYEPL